jgi:hypothetical protein
MKLRIAAPPTLLAMAAALLPAAPAAAGPLVRQATGANPAAIQGAVNQFRADLGGGTTPGQNGSFGGVRREINWDGVPDAFADPNAFPGGFFNANSPRGAQFATPGLSFLVSADDDNPTDPDPDLVRFSSLQPSFATAFSTFSPQRLFTPLGSPITDTTFFVPGTDTQATTNGFGVVFTDVDTAGSARLDLIGPNGEQLGRFPVPPTAGDGSLSFVGVSFDAGEQIARARTISGAAAITQPAQLDVTQGGAADLVVMDDFIYGEPRALQVPGPDRTAPKLKLTGVRKSMKLAKFLKGVKVSITPDEEASLDVSLLAAARRATISAKFNLTLASKSLGFSKAKRNLKLKPARKLIGKAKRFKVQLRIVATDRSGNRGTVTRQIRVRK